MGLVWRGHNAHIMAATPVGPLRWRAWEIKDLGTEAPTKGQRMASPRLPSLWRFEKSCHCWLPCRGMNARAQQGAW